MKTRKGSKILCSEVTKYICENLDEQLNSRKCRAIRQHLKNCSTCPKDLAHMKKIVALYKNIPVPPMKRATERKLFAALSLKENV